MTPIGIFAIWGDWITAETGREPWLVYGKLLIAAAVSPLHVAGARLADGVHRDYLTLLGVYIWYVARAVRQGPSDEPEAPSPRPRPETHPDPVLES